MKVSAAVSAAVVALVALFAATGANAAITQRGDDPVVLKGTDLSGLTGAQPDKLVGFKWTGNAWEQIPVQVDERHKISVRTLYPEDAAGNPYLGPKSFNLEVYADENTRSGADANASFDADDELVFMGGDAGDEAPLGASAPAGVDPKSGVKLDVADPVGDGTGAVYLYRATGNLDPAAGQDYVDYQFKLTNLGPGQTLLNDYGYVNSSNPEDSTVSTDNYELHSFDRWMEDEMKVKAGASTGEDILDREVAQAFLTQCGRTEYTFSGRWTEDTWAGNDGATDDEGTYIIAKDGPVRALRSYMGANSGPYVQREHIYYRSHEQNTIFLRVHLMADLYSWTDYAPSAIGMTYRDEKNVDGVTIDGNPDALTPTTSDDVANGTYSWQQVSGEQGTVSTVVGAETDIPNPNFGNYYLDDATPDDPDEVQCGGDEQSIGASGFGILGPITPNTDPRSDPFNNLTVERVRYFGPPSEGAAAAAAYRDRVAQPLAATASPYDPGSVKLKVNKAGKLKKAKKGKKYKVGVKVKNAGDADAKSVKVCVKSSSLKKGGTCKKVKSLAAGKVKQLKLKTKVKGKAKGKKLKLKLTAKSGDAKATKKVAAKYKKR